MPQDIPWKSIDRPMHRTTLPFSAAFAILRPSSPWSRAHRTKAARALGNGKAGAAPALRLGLISGKTLLDPGFYQLWTVLQDFKRVLNKTPSMLDWQHYVAARCFF